MSQQELPKQRRHSATEARSVELGAEAQARASIGFPVVGIGASAGGLAAFEAFFAAMPPPGDDGMRMSFVLVQHLAPDHKSLLAEIVQRYTRLRVREVADGQAVQPDTTYIIPPGHDLTLERDGTLRLQAHAERHAPHLTVDHFFASLAAAHGERAIGIVMSGAGSDGTMGLRQIKAEGGLAIAQAPESAEHAGMPRSAVESGIVDHVVAPAQMPQRLLAYVRHAFDPARRRAFGAQRDSTLSRLCVLLRMQTGHDFSQYKETTLLRRMERRMALLQIVQAEDYLRHAREHPQEVQALFRDLLIGVTQFFRDTAAFKALEEKVIARIVAGKGAHEGLRVWVCGCSTGEEAYSIAILLHEHAMAAKRPLKLQVFATDIDRHAVEHARNGAYPASIAPQVGPERLARYFTNDAQRGTYRIRKHIRDLLVFSEQDVIRDPPFSRLDLVSCRNLLIYLNGDLQRKLIPLFHYALLPGGALFLGSSETVGESARLFHAADRKWKIYVRLPAANPPLRPLLADLVPPRPEAGDSPRAAVSRGGGPDSYSLRRLTERALLAHCGQAGVLVDARGQILHIVGRTGRYLEPADGDADMNVLAMSREGLRRELTIALHQAVARKEAVSCRGLVIQAGDDPVRANLVVRPVEDSSGALMYLVALEEVPARPTAETAGAGDAEQADRISDLDRELRAKDEYLQTALEEMESTNEELKSTNEEMQSVNEELQSTNEELQTSKEELQAVNEELSTVNSELQDRVADLSRANNDMNNLLAGTGVGTVFVDHRLRITRFTPAATPVISLIPNDVGRPLEHVVTNLVAYDQLTQDISAVLDTLVQQEVEVQVKGGDWYLMRIRPYRTMDNLIEGAAITFVDISARRRAEEALRHSEARLALLINRAYAGVSAIDPAGRLQFANDRLCEVLRYSREELMTLTMAAITDPEDLPRVRELYAALTSGGPETQLRRRYLRKDGARLPVVERVSAIRDGGGRTNSLLSVWFDELDRPEGD